MDIVSSIVFISCPSLRTCSENLDLPSAYLKSFLCSLNLVLKLQDRNTNIIAGTTVENKGKLITYLLYGTKAKSFHRPIMRVSLSNSILVTLIFY